MAVPKNAKDLTLPYVGDITATGKAGWRWFVEGLKEFFSSKMFAILGIEFACVIVLYFVGFIPFASTIVTATASAMIYILLVERHFHGSCSFQTLISVLGQKFLKVLFYAISTWVLSFVLYAVGVLLILIIYGSEIWSLGQWLWQFAQTHDVLNLIMNQNFAHLEKVCEAFLNEVGLYLFKHPFIVFHWLIGYSIFLLIDLTYFICTFFAVPLTIYGEVSAPKALWISFKSCSKNWWSLTVAWIMVILFKLLFVLPFLLLGFVTMSGFATLSGTMLIAALIGQGLIGMLSTFFFRVLSVLDSFVNFRACRWIFWGKYDEILKKTQDQYANQSQSQA